MRPIRARPLFPSPPGTMGRAGGADVRRRHAHALPGEILIGRRGKRARDRAPRTIDFKKGAAPGHAGERGAHIGCIAYISRTKGRRARVNAA